MITIHISLSYENVHISSNRRNIGATSLLFIAVNLFSHYVILNLDAAHYLNVINLYYNLVFTFFSIFLGNSHGL